MTVESSTAYTKLHPHFQERLKVSEPLAQHSSFGVGGPADLWVEVKTRAELVDLITLCARERWPLLLMGGGSNILYADAGVRGIVASIALSEFYVEAEPDGTGLLVADAGVRWSQLLPSLVEQGWGGLEFGVGIPGTLGAGIVSNVGAHHQEVGQSVEWIDVLDARACNETRQEHLDFPVTVIHRCLRDSLDLSYRHSRFRDQRLAQIDEHGKIVLPKHGLIEPAEMILTVALRVQRSEKQALADTLERYRHERKSADPEQKHLGSIFQDPAGSSAHTLIEQVGLAGSTHGKAQISNLNANYIVNLGGATASDIAALMVQAHQKVLAATGIQLVPNVELLGEWQL